MGAIGVKVDWAARSLEHRACPALPCNAVGGQKIAIDLPGVTEANVRVDAVPVADAKSILHVSVRAKKGDAAWEALIAPSEGSGSQVLFAGPTGFTRGEPGDRRGDAVALLPRDGDRARFVVVGSLTESVAMCGEPRTLIAPRALDTKSMTLRSASVQQLSPERRAKATKLVARARPGAPEKPLARLLVPVGTSDGKTSAAALVDGNVTTRWSEGRTGIGAGEIVVLRAPNRVSLTRLTIVPLPPKPEAPKTKGATPPSEPDLAAPKSIFLLTDDKTYAIELPEDASSSRGAFDVTLPQPIRSQCVSVVLDEAYARGIARPEVSLAEIVAYSDLDVPGATLEQVARTLASGSTGETAAEVLKRGGPEAAAAIATVYPTLEERGRQLALDVASAAGGCDAGARVMLRALGDSAKDVATRADKMLVSCGPAAAPTLLAALENDEPMQKGRAAGVLSLVSPSRSLKPISAQMGKGEPRARALLRSAFARASKRAPPEQLAELVAEAPREARPDMLRALSGRLSEIRERASLAANEWLEKDASFAARYLALEPLAELARAGDAAASTRFVAMLGGDPDWPVRSRAAALAGPVPAAHGVLLKALEDAEPRVREAALRAVAERANGAAAVRVGALLGHDPWTYVRLAAANALGSMPAAPDLDRTLADALRDGSPRVRVEVLDALGRHRANTFAEPVRERLEDEREPLEVRVAAVSALGAMCDAESLDTFTTAARRLTLPYPDKAELDLGVAAVKALAVMHPKDLERRLAPLLAKDVKASVREVATQAIAERGQCR